MEGGPVKEFPTDIAKEIILNLFKKTVLNNVWLVSQQNNTRYTHEMIYFVIYFAYVLINKSWSSISYSTIESIRNWLLNDWVLKSVVSTAEDLLSCASKYKTDNITTIFSECFNLFWLEIDFPHFPNDVTWFTRKKICEISRRNKIKILDMNSWKVSSIKRCGVDYLLESLHNLVFFRVGDLSSHLDFVVIHLFLLCMHKIAWDEISISFCEDHIILWEMINHIFNKYEDMIKYDLLSLPKETKLLSRIQIKRLENPKRKRQN